MNNTRSLLFCGPCQTGKTTSMNKILTNSSESIIFKFNRDSKECDLNIVLETCNTYPKLKKLLLIDDIEMISDLNHDLFRKILHNSRHMNLDVVVSVQCIKFFNPAERRMFDDIVFTSLNYMIAYISMSSTGIPKEIKQKIQGTNYDRSTMFHVDKNFNVTHN